MITQPDRRKGRGRKLSKNEVKALANDLQIEIFQPKSLSSLEARRIIKNLKADVLVVAAYGQIIPQEVLDIPLYGGINVHASVLPRWRGAAPIERAIMAGDTKSGISIMQMDKGLDTGPIYKTALMSDFDQLSVKEIEEELARLGGNELIKTLEEFQMHKNGDRVKPATVAQDDFLATYAHKINPEDRMPNWKGSAYSLNLQIKALAYRQPVTVQIDDLILHLLRGEGLNETQPDTIPGKILEIRSQGISVACGEGTLRITMVKLNRGQGKPMDIKTFLNGYGNALTTGMVLATSNAK